MKKKRSAASRNFHFYAVNGFVACFFSLRVCLLRNGFIFGRERFCCRGGSKSAILMGFKLRVFFTCTLVMIFLFWLGEGRVD